LREISAWFQPRVEFKAANMIWFAQFALYYADKSDKEKIEIFIETIALFFEENNDFNLPNWDL